MDFIFAQRELALLDDLMPEQTRRKKEDDTINLAETRKEEVCFCLLTTVVSKKYLAFLQRHHGQLTESQSTGVISVPLPNGHVMKIPKIGAGTDSSLKNGQASSLLLEQLDEKKEQKSPRSGR